MSKSHGNVIVPEVVADKYGVDVVRMYLMFMGPFNGTMAWNENTLMGVKRFLDKFEKAMINLSASSNEDKVIINKTIDGVTKDLENFGYNTAIAKLMECLNKVSGWSREESKKIIKLIAPFAPYLAEELWNESESVHAAEWPKVEEKYLVESEMTIPVAINGKVRAQIKVANDEKEVIVKAKELEEVKKWLEGKKIIKEIYVPGKMVNIVLV